MEKTASIKSIGGIKPIKFKYEPGIYFLSLRGIIVYVGQSLNPMRRIQEHVDEGIKDFDAAYFRPCEKSELDQMESFFIHSLEPIYNYTMANGKKFSPMLKEDCMALASTNFTHRLSDSGRSAHQEPKPIMQRKAENVKTNRERLIRLPEVEAITGVKKSFIYAGMRSGTFPQSSKVSRRCTVWPITEIYRWCESQLMVPGAGIEPARLAAGDFESPASTNFTTRACV